MNKKLIMSIASCLVMFCFNIEAREREGVIFEVNKYSEAGNPSGDPWNNRRCSENVGGGDLPVSFLSMGTYLRDKMEDNNWEFRRHQNTAVDWFDFLDSEDDDVRWTGVDCADVAYYLGHGSYRTTDPAAQSHQSGTTPPQNYVYFTMGEDHTWLGNQSQCRVSSQEMRLGHDTEIFISGACMHGRYMVFKNQNCGYPGGECDGFDAVRDGQLSVWNAWHSHGQNYVNEYQDYVNTSWYRGVGENWVDMTQIDSSTDARQNGEHCLVSITWGGNDPDYQWDVTSDNIAVRNAAWRFHRAGIGANWTPVPGHNYTHSTYFFVAGCCPFDGSTNHGKHTQADFNTSVADYCDEDQLPGPRSVKYYFKSN